LVLDRGHHSLFGVDLSGSLIFRLGRLLPDSLEFRWLLPGDSRQPQASPLDIIRECLPYDPLFMPYRIFGNTTDSIFIYEPKSNRLKFTAFGNLLPVWIPPPDKAEWVAADARGLLCYSKMGSLLWWYDADSSAWLSSPIEGSPIFSSGSYNEIWSQNGDVLNHWTLFSGERSLGHQRLWHLPLIPVDIDRALKADKAFEDIPNLSKIATLLHDQLKEAAAIPLDQWLDPAFSEKTRKDLTAASAALRAALLRFNGFARTAFLALLKIHAMQFMQMDTDRTPYLTHALNRIKEATQPLHDLFKEMLLFRDDIFAARLGEAISRKDPGFEAYELLMHDFHDALMIPTRELSRLLWYLRFCDSAVFLFESPEKPDSPPLLAISAPFPIPIFKISTCLREIDRIFVGEAGSGDHVAPANICYDPDSGFWATLNNSGQVLHLNEQGQVIGPVAQSFSKPYGIAMDSAKRIWVSHPLQNSITIFDARTNQLQMLKNFPGAPPDLKFPTGIFKAANGNVLIADTLNRRILFVSDDRIAAIDNMKSESLREPVFPVAFCGSDRSSEFRVVDVRNHCIRQLDFEGALLGIIGGAGLCKGNFVLPESVSVFDDGTLAVSQFQCTRNLTLLSRNGEEIEALELDYSPLGVLAHKQFLFVCEISGNHIHVYERR
jgi:hypothetical protein